MIYNKELLIKYCAENSVILDKEYDKVNRDTRIEGKCINDCDNHFNKGFRSMVEIGALCKTCSVKNGVIKQKELFMKKYNGHPLKTKEVREKCKKNNMAKYGVENTFQLEKFKEKGKQTCLEKYGVQYATQNKEIKEKRANTNIELYGSANTFQVEEFKEKSRQTCLENHGVEYSMQNKEIKEKSKKTCLEKYGCEFVSQNTEIMNKMKQHNMEKYGFEHVLQVEEIREKGKKNNMEKYGVENCMQRPEIKEKVKQTNLKLYGSENIFQVEEFKEKGKQTSLLHFGVPHPMQNAEIMSKNTASQYKKKPYILPSKKEISIQGYEHFALDELLKTYNEDDIITGNENVPELWYESNDKRHRHYVDIFIPNENLCIEVKSNWTLNSKKDNIFIKQAAAKDLGYKYEIWVYNNKGNKIETFK
jgi:hypothetical protein